MKSNIWAFFDYFFVKAIFFEKNVKNFVAAQKTKGLHAPVKTFYFL